MADIKLDQFAFMISFSFLKKKDPLLLLVVIV